MPKRPALTLLTFGFKYGVPHANHWFDVSFLRNPARQEGWTLFDQPDAGMRAFVLEQPECARFLDALVALLGVLAACDDDLRVGIGCSSGRHRSRIVAEELKRRLEAEGAAVRLIHREEVYS